MASIAFLDLEISVAFNGTDFQWDLCFLGTFEKPLFFHSSYCPRLQWFPIVKDRGGENAASGPDPACQLIVSGLQLSSQFSAWG